MATILKDQRERWAVDWTDADGVRHRQVVAENTKAAAQAEAARLTAEVDAIRAGRRVPNKADTPFVFAQWLASTRPQLDRTRQRYESAMNRHFVPFFNGRQPRFYNITVADVEAFRNERLASGAAAKTVWNEMTMLRQVFGWAVDRGFIASNVAAKVDKLGAGKKLPSRLPKHFSEAQVAQILGAAWSNPRVYLMFCLGLRAGLRTGGVCDLRTADVHLDDAQPWIKVTEKGDKDRVIPCDPMLVEAFQRYRAQDGEYWFGPMTDVEKAALSVWLCGFIREATGLEGEAGTFHCCRHTFAVTCLRQGVDLVTLSKLLGHSDISTTQIYLRVENADFHRAIGLLKPVEFAKG
jgi:integrase/recombinase XerD